MAIRSGAATVAGELRQWHKVTLDLKGPQGREDADTFLDHRLDVTFRHSGTGREITVPGYFAADGDAADTGAKAGDVWRVHFNPPETGNWTWKASFRTGDNVAVSPNAKAGSAVKELDGQGGSLSIGSSNKGGDDLRGRGVLEHDGDRYLNFAGDGEVFLKSGVGSPENFLGYEGFDNTPGTHDYGPHTKHFRGGDPTWSGGEGRGIIGAVNYLADQGVNSAYMLLMNVGGDGQDVWPWAATDLDEVRKNAGNARGSQNLGEEARSFDVSKLGQWEKVFEHMQEKGIVMHLFLQETENDFLLNDGNMGTERALFMREMVARFGHHNGIIWNLGEENTNTDAQIRAQSKALKALDPYDHPVALHTYPSQHSKYEAFQGEATLDVLSFQSSGTTDMPDLGRYLGGAEKAGRPVVGFLDEPGTASIGVAAKGDPGWQRNHDELRDTLWRFYADGGSGAEWYFGYKTQGGKGGDLAVEDFSTREGVYAWAQSAREFFEDLPLERMSGRDGLTSGTAGSDEVLAAEGDTYAIYLPEGGSATLDLKGEPGRYDVTWYDPLTGRSHDGTVDSVTGGGSVSIGQAPFERAREWAVTVEKTGGAAPAPAPSQPTPTQPAPEQPAAGRSGSDGDVYRMRDGLVVMQAEDGEFVLPSASGNDTWKLEKDLQGFKGDGYMLFDSAKDYFQGSAAGTPATGPLSYTFRVDGDDAAGRYFISLRAMKPETGEPSDRNNDFYVAAGPAGEDPSGWKKVFFSGGAEKWLWGTRYDVHDAKSPATFEIDGPGEYTIYVSGRSRQAGLDEIHVQKGKFDLNAGAPTSPLVDGAAPSRPDPEPAPSPKPEPEPQPGGSDGGDGLAINLGSSKAFRAADGTLFAADRTGVGSDFAVSGAIAGTRDDALYRTEAFGKSLGYEFALGNGTYDVSLHFAEVWTGAFAKGKRVMDVSLEGSTVRDDLDIFSEVGKLKALVTEHRVTVRDGVLDLDLEGEVQNAMLSALQIERVGGASKPEPTEPEPAPTKPAPAGDDDGTLSLIDARTDETLFALGERTVIDADGIAGRELAVVAEPDGRGVASAVMLKDGKVTRVENEAPFALDGDIDGDFLGGIKLSDGSAMTVGATFHGAEGGRGARLGEVSARLEVQDGTLSGRSGEGDVFAFDETRMGRDTVTGFEEADTLVFFGGVGARAVVSRADVSGRDTVIDFGGGDVLTLKNYTSLSVDDIAG